MNHAHWLIALLLLTFGCERQPSPPSQTNASAPATIEKIPPAVYRRTVFLGDSITDGNTYPQLVRDEFAARGLPVMIAINAGIGGDTAKGMRARLERDVLAFHPTLVTFSAGANDALHGVSPQSYEEEVRAIADRLKKENIPLILLTPNVLGSKHREKGQANLDAYEAILRKIAKEQNLRIAEVNQRQKTDILAFKEQLAPDGVHPNWEGQSMIALAVLDAMGYSGGHLPDEIADAPLPGIIAQWQIKAFDPKAPPLTESAVAQLSQGAGGDGWITLKLPEKRSLPELNSNDHWLDGYRAQGASIALRRQPPGRFVGVATIASDTAHAVQFHTGAELEQIWLNGKLIYQNTGIRGFHIGRESVAAELKQGENVVVIRTGPVFFLSMTEHEMWAEK